MANVILHQWEISPFCRKVRKVLQLKGVPFRTVDYNGMRAPQAARLSMSGKLPVLDWDGQRIADSSRICAFLEQQVPQPPLYPVNRRDAALARLLEDWADESLYAFEMHFRAAYPESTAKATELLCAGRPAWERRVVGPLFRRGLNKRLKGYGFGGLSNQEIEARFFGHVDDLADWLEGREWLVGESQSIADLAASAQLEEMLSTNALAARLLERPTVAAWLKRSELR